MNKKIGIIAALVCAFVLCFALVGCGGGSVDKTKFTGTWTLESGSDENLDADSIELMKSLGLEVNLTLNDDDTGKLDMFGQQEAVTWEATSATEGKLSMEGSGSANLKVEDNKLVMSDDSSSMTFAKKS
ncbi:MAG: hypothetical protein J6D25_00980 [Eggerthellaceae bacterium]|nr:hypothetical protein [Eggerthellaceae bacterium]